MRWYLDTEFNDTGSIIELISIGLVSQNGVEYYAVSSEFNEATCSAWVQTHVLPRLGTAPRKSRSVIAREVEHTVLSSEWESPEFWAYYGAYDWVALCQLYGGMVEMPRGFPWYYMDIQQLMHDRGILEKSLPLQAIEEQHHALADAKWNKLAHELIRTLEKR